MTVRPQTAPPSPVGCPRPQAAAHVSLVAFAHAGGGPVTFRPWAEALAPDIELWCVTLPGRARRWREPLARAWPFVVDELATAIAREVPAPVALLGHSLGALLAFEVARALTRDHVPPVHLYVSGRAAPELAPAIDVPESDDELLREIDRLCAGVPEIVLASPEVRDHFVPILRADLELACAYSPGAEVPLTCPITALSGDGDPLTPQPALAGWREHTNAGLEVRVLPGGHFYLFEQASAVVAEIRRCLTPQGRAAA